MFPNYCMHPESTLFYKWFTGRKIVKNPFNIAVSHPPNFCTELLLRLMIK